MSVPNVIQWYENKALDDPKLRSPSPCPRGVYCQYKLPNPETKELELACCRMVHPGEEGNGRRLFPARQAPDGRQQPACVRLTGKAGFYERCRLKQPWRAWATEQGIPLPPADVPWVQVERGPILPNPQAEINERHRAMKRYHYQCVAERHAAERRAAEGGSDELQERVADMLATQQMARAALQNSRVERKVAAAMSAAAMSAAATSVSDWPSLARPPQRPSRLALSGGGVTYGFSSCDRLRLPPQIVRQNLEGLE
jgi:hypothetical protein